MRKVDYEAFKIEVDAGVAHVTLNRAATMNAMGQAFWRECREVFARVATMPQVRAVVLASTGKHFSAGMDLSLLSSFVTAAGADPARVGEQRRRKILELQECFNEIERCRVPVLAGVHGAAIGAALDMICACDIRYCTADAYFVIQEVNVGMTADLGTLQRLPHLVPSGLARELAFTGRKLSAGEALQCGFVTRVFADQEELTVELRRIALEIAARSPMAMIGTKEMLNYARDHSVAEGLSHVAVWNAGIISAEDMAEGSVAREAKRSARYQDLLG